MYYILGLLLIFCILFLYCALTLASNADDDIEEYFEQKDKS